MVVRQPVSVVGVVIPLVGIGIGVVIVPSVVPPTVVIEGIVVAVVAMVAPAWSEIPGIVEPGIMVGGIPGIIIAVIAPTVPIRAVVRVVIAVVIVRTHPARVPIHVIQVNIGSVLHVNVEVFAVCDVRGEGGVVEAPDAFGIRIGFFFHIQGFGKVHGIFNHGHVFFAFVGIRR